MSDSTNSLDQKILDWLGKHGYPLEMTVAKAFQDAGMHVDQSVYYRDPETDTPREIDVVAGFRDGEYADYFFFSCQFCVECKKSTYPWVVFTGSGKRKTPLSRGFYSTKQFFQTWVGSTLGESVMHKLPLNLTVKHEFNQCHRIWGTGITTALRDGKDSRKDVPYEAMMGAAKSSYAITQQADKKNQTRKSQLDQQVLYGAMAQSVVVLDGNLFEAELNESGEIEIKQVDESIVLFRYPFSPSKEAGTAIRIVTLPKLQDFAERAKEYRGAITGCVEAQEKAYHEHYKPQRSLKEMSEAAQASRKQTPDIGDR